MTEIEQGIAIAEACGFVWYRVPGKRDDDRHYRMLAHPAIHEYGGQAKEWLVRADGTERICTWKFMPDYLHDWNAMRSALDTMNEDEWHDFYYEHLVIAANPSCYWRDVELFRATLPQCAEAFLRVKGKWPKTDHAKDVAI